MRFPTTNNRLISSRLQFALRRFFLQTKMLEKSELGPIYKSVRLSIEWIWIFISKTIELAYCDVQSRDLKRFIEFSVILRKIVKQSYFLLRFHRGIKGSLGEFLPNMFHNYWRPKFQIFTKQKHEKNLYFW